MKGFSIQRQDFKLTSEMLIPIGILLILGIPNLVVLFNFTDIQGNIGMMVAYLILSFFVWTFPLIFLPKKTYFLFAYALFLLAPLEIGFVSRLGTPMNVGFMEAVWHTDWLETKEQLTSNYVLLLVMLVLSVLYFLLWRKLKPGYFSLKLRAVLLGFFLVFNLLIFAQMYRILNHSEMRFSKQLNLSLHSTFLKYDRVFPINLFTLSYQYHQNNKKARELAKNVEDFSFDAQSLNPSEEEEVVVLVLGETARYSNFQLNGYSRETNPLLSQQENLLSFSDLYSEATLTSISIPLIVTRATAQQADLQYQEKSIVELFGEAGYYTAWLANQSSQNSFIKRIGANVDYFKANPMEVSGNRYFDEVVLEDLDKVLEQPQPKKMVVIHSLGSHFRYTSRYPEAFEKFKPVMSETGYSHLKPENRAEIVNAYDNSILYTDYFLNQVIERLEKLNQKAVFLYLSDHGENLYDEGKHIFHGSSEPTKYEYHIPMLVWLSDTYLENASGKYRNLQANRSKKAVASQVFYTLTDLANLSYKNSKEEKIHSLADSTYVEPTKRYLLNSEKKIMEAED